MQALINSNNLLIRPAGLQPFSGGIAGAGVLQAGLKPLPTHFSGASALQQRFDRGSQAGMDNFMQRLESSIETAMSKVLTKVVSLLAGPEAGAEVANAMGLSAESALAGAAGGSFAVPESCCACCETGVKPSLEKTEELSLFEELKQIFSGEAAKTDSSQKKESGFWGFLSAAREGVGTLGSVLGLVGKAANFLKKIF